MGLTIHLPTIFIVWWLWSTTIIKYVVSFLLYFSYLMKLKQMFVTETIVITNSTQRLFIKI